MYINNEKREVISSYLNKSFLKKILYIGRGLDKAEAIIDYINSDYSNQDKKYNALVRTLWRNDTSHIKDIFSGKDSGALKLLLGDSYSEVFSDVWERATLYTYSTGLFRRSYRTNRASALYLHKNIEKLKEFIYLAAADFSLDKYLADNRSDYKDISVIADIISVEIDKNDQEVLSKIRDIIYNDNNTAIITREIIKGMLMSRNGEAHKMIGDLLLAAKLQEGLRQAIVESMDECSREGFIYLMKVIIDNDLMRFSSVVRAFGTWSGLALDVERPKAVKKCIDAAYNCLINKEYLNECIDSDDNLLIYIGIWATAFDEVEDIDQILDRLLTSNEKYKKLVALQFLYETQFTLFKHQKACEALWEKDLEILAIAIKNIFSDLGAYSLRREAHPALEAYSKLGDDYFGIKLFDRLREIVDSMPKKEIEFKGSVFPWVDISLAVSEVLDRMIFAVSKNYTGEIVDILLAYLDKMSLDTRQVFVDVFLERPTTISQKVALLQLCGDRSSSVRNSAFAIANKLNLDDEDYSMIENLLQYKSGDLRKNAIKLLLKQPTKDLSACVRRLIGSNNENKRLAAIDIVSAVEGNMKYKEMYDECRRLIISLDDATQKEKMLTKNIFADKKESKSFENGFGLYDKTKDIDLTAITKPKGFSTRLMLSMTADEFKSILNKFSSLIHEHRDYEYETEGWDGTKTVVTLGGTSYLQPFERNDYSLDNYPIADEIRELAVLLRLTPEKLIEMDFYLTAMHRIEYYKYLPWFDSFADDMFNLKAVKDSMSVIEKIPYCSKIKTYIDLLVNECSNDEKFDIGKNAAEYLYAMIPTENHRKKYSDENRSYFHYASGKDYIAMSDEIKYWLNLLQQSIYDDESFIKYFNIAYSYYKASDYEAYASLNLEHFGRALEMGLIDENEVYKELMSRPQSPNNIRTITSLHRRDMNDLHRFNQLMEIRDRVIDTITEIEVKRGELNTEVTHLAAKINKCWGADIFLSIILNSEKDTYVRGYNFVDGDCTKKQMLSHLLKCCYPRDNDNANTLGELISGKKVTNKQLIEAAMYSPQWLDIVSEYLGIEGLKSVCWYFHAHVNEFFSDEKTTIVARYSPISAQDFKDGAFDGQWFREAYDAVGEKTFKLVYDSAKYIAGGGLHKRSQLFADAVLCKLDLEEVQKRIADKRNKDYLLAYGLIPVESKEDTLRRYEYIHQYIKESKQFGAQRQASEMRSANIALLNLARNAGYSDVNRLSWNMETAKLDSIRSCMLPYKLEDVEIQLSVDETGKAAISCIKDGRTLKDIPAKLKKHEYVQEIKAIRKSLNEQYARARQSFEASMEKEDEFEFGELTNLCMNPVLTPIINNLVFVSRDRLGYLEKNGLVDYKGSLLELKMEDKLMIAHPVHLYQSGHWSDYQRDVFNKRLVQPFKQVFRELYLPNSDELKEQIVSRRYAGHQVQLKKTLALLKTRGWLASYEEGLEKVYYKEGIIATIYALADWFSPAEIEAPVIELVRFEDRKTYKPIPIDKVPKLIFSEVMRDVDLVVSVAHVGGVDPEASLSTIEMRDAIIGELLKLLKLDNVSIKGSHAHIKGVHGEYTVHLGSGVAHKMGIGALNILPVHSQHRGRIFLPFVDEDPKTAEIISKIVLLAEDRKLKDPSILNQIN